MKYITIFLLAFIGLSLINYTIGGFVSTFDITEWSTLDWEAFWTNEIIFLFGATLITWIIKSMCKQIIMKYSHEKEMAIKKEYFWVGVKITLMAVILIAVIAFTIFSKYN